MASAVYPAIATFNYLLLGYTILYTIIIVIFYILRRNKRPIKQRSGVIFGLQLFSTLILVIFITIYNVTEQFVPCLVMSAIASFAFPLYCIPLFFKVWRVFVNYTIHGLLQEKIYDPNVTYSMQEKVTILCRVFRKMSADIVLMATWIVFMFFHVVILVIIISADSYMRTFDKCTNVPIWVTIFGVLQCIYIIPIIISLILAWRAKEPFFITAELYIMLGCSLLGVLWFALVMILRAANVNVSFPDPVAPFGYLMVLAMSIGQIVPLAMTFDWSKVKDFKAWWTGQKVESSKEAESIIAEILQDEKLKMLFQEYCAREWISEYYYFIIEVNRFNKTPERHNKMSMIEEMMERFIDNDGILVIQISANLKLELDNRYEHLRTNFHVPADDFFKEAYEEVCILLHDSLLRFKKSKQYINQMKKDVKKLTTI